jgi:hypothetical protein
MWAIKNFVTEKSKILYYKVKEYFSSAKRWFLTIPEIALLQAYKSAQVIQKIEEEHFADQTSPLLLNNGKAIIYLQEYIKDNLRNIKVKLTLFNWSRSLLNISDPTFLEKLQFIDTITAKHELHYEKKDISPTSQLNIIELTKVKPSSHKTGILPRSIGRTINKIKDDLSPEAEEKHLQTFHISQKRTRIAAKFLAMIIIVPLLTQIVSKQILVNPILKRVNGDKSQIFLNVEMKEDALRELKKYEEKLNFENLIYKTPHLSPEVIEEKVKDKAIDITNKFRLKSSSAISNIFADLISLIAFSIVVLVSKKEIIILKFFIDDVIYGLSDSAKAFLIILFTDIFVGFHSPHGWEVILDISAAHFGIPASKSYISLFIATFPVILDTIIKYWIFSYLSKWSPSALATLKDMKD